MPRLKNARIYPPWLLYSLLLLLAVLAGLMIIYSSIVRPFCANSLSCEDSFSQKIENGSLGLFNGKEIQAPVIGGLNEEDSRVLGESDGSDLKHISIDITRQTLKAYEGDKEVLSTFISSGKWFDTPVGEFKIWHMVKATRMSGGTGNDYYNLPNVPYVMFFQNDKIPGIRGFGIHGAYWHNNFGHAMSHGCVNMRIIDAERLFNWAELGTKITIYES
jgi:hypothetical protein